MMPTASVNMGKEKHLLTAGETINWSFHWKPAWNFLIRLEP